MIYYPIKKIIITLFVFFSTAVYANDHDHDHDHDNSEHKQHEAHVHGKAEMNILIDEKTFIFELNSPALNFLGFEHVPETNEEKETLKQVNKMLLDYKNVISIPGINCKESQIEISAPYGNDKEEHGHHHGEDHDDDHSEYYLFYSIACEDINNIEQIKIKLFDNFRGFESVNVKWTYFTDAGSLEATEKQKIVKLQ